MQSANFTANIHERNFRSPFEKVKATSGTLVAVDGRNLRSLNGNWHFIEDWYETALRSCWCFEDSHGEPADFDWDFWPMAKVPSVWNLAKPELKYFEGLGCYMRTFDQPKTDGRLFLQFEGASYRTYVFLNHHYLGMHDGGSTPFTLEITDVVQEKENRLMVCVDGRRDPERVPMDNTDWFLYGGIYRDVFLFETPKNYLSDWYVRLLPDKTHIALDFTVEGANEGSAVFSIPELGVNREVLFQEGKGTVVVEARPELWDIASPRLYQVSLAYGKDFLSDQIGFRTIRVEGTKVLLNDRPVFLKGISCHEDYPEGGKRSTESDRLQSIKDAQELGAVFMRLAHYPHSREMARLADRMGMLLWEEIPVYWAIDFQNEGTYQDAENQLRELIRRDKNRASVIIWSVGNENEDTDDRLSFMSRLAETAKHVDPSRLVSAACLVNQRKLAIEDRLMPYLDVIGNNEYYGWYDQDFTKLPRILANSHLDKPVVITEFGGGARLGTRGSEEEMWTEEYQKRLYEKQFAMQRSCPFIQGCTPWILYDFRAPRRMNRHQEGFNRKGLIDSDHKRKKLAWQVVHDYYHGL